jgi:hypothetical protein
LEVVRIQSSWIISVHCFIYAFISSMK